jgi:hypothetical protein
MTTIISLWSLLSSGAPGLLTAISGNFTIDPQVRECSIGFRPIVYDGMATSTHVLRVTLEASPVGEEDWATFHDVRLVGLDELDATLYQHRMGTEDRRGELDVVTLECAELPQTILFRANE